MSCHPVEISGSACNLHPWEFSPTLPHCREDAEPVGRLSVARDEAVLAEQPCLHTELRWVCGNGVGVVGEVPGGTLPSEWVQSQLYGGES